MKYEQKDGGALALFDRPVVFHRIFVDWTGSIKAALMLSVLVFWQRVRPGGWIYRTRNEWWAEVGLNRTEQENARKALRDRGFIEERLMGRPAKIHSRVKEAFLTKLTKHQLAGNLPTIVGGKPTNQLAGNPPTNTENTTYSGRGRCGVASDGLIAPEDSRVRFSKAVSVYAIWSRKRGYHLRSKVPLLYARGAEPGGWSRITLIKWQKAYSVLCATLTREKVNKLIQFYLKHHDDDYAPEARTLLAFAQRWEKIDKFMRRRLRERNGHSHQDDYEPPKRDAIKPSRVLTEAEGEKLMEDFWNRE